jgi:hypothetical protein
MIRHPLRHRLRNVCQAVPQFMLNAVITIAKSNHKYLFGNGQCGELVRLNVKVALGPSSTIMLVHKIHYVIFDVDGTATHDFPCSRSTMTFCNRFID